MIILNGKLFYSGNRIPTIIDDSDARFRREIYLSFPYQYEEGRNADPRLLEKLTTDEELSGIFNIFMIALRTIQRNDRIYLNQKTIQARREKHELLKDPINAFLKIVVVKIFFLQIMLLKKI